MITDFEVVIPKPKFDITDPFGLARIKRARWEYKRKAAECESLHYEIEQLYSDRETAMSKLVIAAMDLQNRLDKTEQMYRSSEETRKNLAAKNSEMSKKIGKLEEETAMYKAKCDLLEGDLKELEKEHERVIRGLTDKGEIA